ncbi:MAG: protein-L-isoaspartate(D-aspartate) O-methyltransferase [Elusimicrobia bacterium]|nr:protein-L-isoaspartate(D-aspartate) O-methyltransferase [Elusimicrobiota bacterium]
MVACVSAFACAAGNIKKSGAAPKDEWLGKRLAMVDLIANYSQSHRVTDKTVIEAMKKVPRHRFVPSDVVERAYDDTPLMIGEGQTISQPFIVGYMTELLSLKPSDKVLEIGTGSGYQAAVLSLLAKEVYTIEIIESLGRRAGAALRELGYKNVKVKIGDGYRGWPENAPFNAVIVTCAPEDIPKPLIDQLKTGGRMVIPVGRQLEDMWTTQELIVLIKTDKGIVREKKLDVRFVSMTGEAQRKPEQKKRPQEIQFPQQF